VSSLFAKLMDSMVTDDDRAMASEFCNSIGCTVVHHLRDELPAFVATVRARGRQEVEARVVTELAEIRARLDSVLALQRDLDKARSEAKVWHEQSDRWERAANEAKRDVNLALDEKNEIEGRLSAAFRWYADEEWDEEWVTPDADLGHRAREALGRKP
jgi:hypothetical protein